MQTFVPKTRRPKFELVLHIHDLNNVPLVSGTSFIKWHLPSSTAAEHRGRTQKSVIKDHRVQYEYEKTMPVKLTVGKDGMLQKCSIDFEVLQEYSSAGRSERISLGLIKFNLAEYVDASELSSGAAESNDPEGIVRRYLMQESKINSTLKIGILMRHLEGPRDYYAPPLKTAPVFGGIAGIISSSEPASTAHGAASQADTDDGPQISGGPVPSLSTTSREIGEMQDMYRRTLAAYWAGQPGELKADDCIEDIFAGGDGWGKKGRPPGFGANDSTSGNNSSKEDKDGVVMRDAGMRFGGSSGSGSLSLNRYKYQSPRKHKTPRKGVGEVDEWEIREDLRAWRIGNWVPKNLRDCS